MSLNPFNAYKAYTKKFGELTGVTQMGKDAYWAASHPLDRLTGKGRAANGRMEIPFGPGGLRPKVFGDPAIQALLKETLPKGPVSPAAGGMRMERLRSLKNEHKQYRLEDVPGWEAEAAAEELGIPFHEMARNMRQSHVAEMLRSPHMDSAGKEFIPTGYAAAVRRRTHAGGTYDSPKMGKQLQDTATGGTGGPQIGQSNSEVVSNYHALLNNMRNLTKKQQDALIRKPLAPVAKAMLVQDMLREGSGMYRPARMR